MVGEEAYYRDVAAFLTEDADLKCVFVQPNVKVRLEKESTLGGAADVIGLRSTTTGVYETVSVEVKLQPEPTLKNMGQA